MSEAGKVEAPSESLIESLNREGRLISLPLLSWFPVRAGSFSLPALALAAAAAAARLQLYRAPPVACWRTMSSLSKLNNQLTS